MRHPTLHRFLMWALLGSICNWRPYRKWQGSHWEKWYVEATHSYMWLDYYACTRDTGGRPYTGRGTPTCESYPVYA